MRAEFIEFNSEWHKECGKCGRAFGAASLEELHAFFGRSKQYPDRMKCYCLECDRAVSRERAKKPKHGSIWARTRCPNKYKARQAVNNAIASGALTKPNRCQACAIACRPHGHHSDYSKPLEVVWLCPPCHRKEHSRV